jgi:oligopeptide transport system substrate-binding protein
MRTRPFAVRNALPQLSCGPRILLSILILTLALLAVALLMWSPYRPVSASSPLPAVRLNLSPGDPILDPARLSAEAAFVADQLFLGLVRADEDTGLPLPDLATSWDMSADATVFTFTLRSGLTWTDGNPLTAYDARYGILRSLDPANGVDLAYPLFYIQNAEQYNSGTMTDSNQVGVTVLDYTHLRFTLKQPAAFFPSVLTLPVSRPMPAWAIAAHPTDWSEPANIVSNGPYRLASWTHGTSLTLDKNPAYYDAANVQIQHVSFVMVDEATAWAMYRAGELDSAAVPRAEWSVASADPILSPQLHAAHDTGTYYYGFNTGQPPFDRLLVRKAFAAAVDRDGLLSTVLGYAEQPAFTFTPPGVWGHVDRSAEGVGIPYDPLQARQWLAAAGYPNGQGLPPVTVMFDGRWLDPNQAIASYLQQGWLHDLGVTVTITYTEWADYVGMLIAGQPQFWQLRWFADYPDAYNFLPEGVDALGRAKYGPWNNPAYAGLLDLAARTADPQQRAGLYQQAEEILVETDAVMVPIYYSATGVATRPELQRTYGRGGYGGRIAGWRMTSRLFLPVLLKGIAASGT